MQCNERVLDEQKQEQFTQRIIIVILQDFKSYPQPFFHHPTSTYPLHNTIIQKPLTLYQSHSFPEPTNPSQILKALKSISIGRLYKNIDSIKNSQLVTASKAVQQQVKDFLSRQFPTYPQQQFQPFLSQNLQPILTILTTHLLTTHNKMKSLTTSSQHQLLSSQNQLLNPKSFDLNPNPNSVKSTHNIPEDDIMNYETLINKLAKGSIADKAIAIKKLLFLYEHSRARIYLYERRIVQSLELCLLIEEKQVSLSGLTLLEKILGNASSESQIGSIFRKKLLSKVILNLGSVDINVRKISHKCIHEFIRKFKDYDAVVTNYLKTALKPQSTTKHLKLKSINSLHSLLMTESKCFRTDLDYALQLIQQLIASSYQKEFVEIRRASLICLVCVLKISGSQNTLKQISMKTQNQLYQLRMESEELANLLDMIMKFHIGKEEHTQENEDDDDSYCEGSQNAPSPKFISIQESEVLIQKPPQASEEKSVTIIPSEHQSLSELEPQPHQLKIFNEVSYAEDFLKRLQKLSFAQFTSESLEEIKSFAPFLEKYLVDQSIKLFSISKKIVEVIFDSIDEVPPTNSEDKLQKHKEVYIVVVPCVVKGIGNKRFIVRKNLDKLVRTYAKNHPDVWISNFLQRFVKTQNAKIKQMLMDLFVYAYKTSPQFYYPVERPFEIFDSEISNKASTLRWKAIDCVILMLERQGKESVIQEMLQKFSVDSYNKILRKLNKNTMTIQVMSNPNQQKITESTPGSNMLDIDIPSPVSAYKRKFRRNHRMITDQGDKMLSAQKDDQTQRNISEERKINLNKGLFFKQKQNRKSYIDYDLKHRRKTQKRSRQSKQRTSLQRLPQLKLKTSANSQSLSKNELPSSGLPQSPVKKSFTEKNIMYTEKSQLQALDDPKGQLEKALATIKNTGSSWMAHFDSINKIRAVIENHPNVISEDHLASIVNDLINCLNGNSRSGVMKISLICLDELMLKLKKRLYPFTQTIIQAILKKSISTSEFMADELRKCICICAQQLCTAKIISFSNSLLKDSKNTQIKLNILLIVQTMIRQQKIYRKECEWIWVTLIELHDEPQFLLRQECKNIVKLIVELYKTSWKSDVAGLKKYLLEKIDKILKNLNQKGENSWLQQENLEFEKILFSKGISAKYFAQQFAKFQQNDRTYLAKKNWKDRIKFINDTFSLGFEYPSQFEININAKKYMSILCQHLDEKNPGLLVNAVNLLLKSIDAFSTPQLIQDIMSVIFQKYIMVLDTKRAQLISIYQKLINKIHQKIDINKILKEMVKVAMSNSLKVKAEALNQIIMILRDDENLSVKKEEKLAVNSSNGSNDKDRSKEKLKNKQNTIKDILVQTPNIHNHNNIKLSYNIGSQTPSATSSSINIQNPPYLSINSQNTIPQPNLSVQTKRKFAPASLNMLGKMVNKLGSDRLYENSAVLGNKLKELVSVCNKKFGPEWGGKNGGSEKAGEFVE